MIDSDLDTIVLSDYLQRTVEGFTGPVTATKFGNGQSNPTYRLDAASGVYVLRRQPSGQLLKSAHAVDREFRVINALRNSTVPVADAYHLCEDTSIIGSMFYIMQYIDGRVLWDPALPDIAKAQRLSYYLSLIHI